MNARQPICTCAVLIGLWFVFATAPPAAAAEPQLTTEQQSRLKQATDLHQQAEGLLRQGKPREAIPIAEQALAIRKKILGEKHPVTAETLTDVGSLLDFTGDYAAARPYLEQALAIRRETLGEKHPDTARALNNIASLLGHVGDFAAARPYLEQALAIRQQVLGESDLDTATSLNNLAYALSQLGENAAARAYYEQALAIRRKILGEKDLGTAMSLHNLGYLLQATGDYSAALPCFRQTLAIRTELLGERHPETARAKGALGTLLEDAGDYAAARPYLEQALEINREALGPKHRDTALALNNLASLLQAMGDYPAAKRDYELALAIKKEVLGDKHPDTALALNNLGQLLCSMGDFTAALKCHEEALAIRKEVLGEKHPDTAQSLNNLGCLLKDAGDYTAARPYLEQALAINTQVKGPKHPSTANSLNSLGNLLQAMGDHAGALSYYQQALAVKREVLGEKHPDTAVALNNLGSLLEDIGDYTAARSNYQQALAIKKERLGEKHPVTAKAINNLGALSVRTGDYATARIYYEQALAINQEVFGKQYPNTAVTLCNLGSLYTMMGNFAAARPYFDEALEIRQKTLGEKHPEVADSLEGLGELLQAQGDYAAARSYYDQALAIRKEVLGERHPDTARSLHFMGWLHQATGDYVAARPYYEEALAIRTEVLGEKHSDTAATLNNLGGLLQDMGDFAAAQPYLEQALAIQENTLGESHVLTAMPRDHLSSILAALGQWSQAAAQMDRSRRIVRRQVARVLPGLSEKEQLAFLDRNDSASYHAGLTLGLHERQEPALCALSAGWLLNDKGVAQEALAQRALLARESEDPKMTEAVQQLLIVRRRLATLSMAAAQPGQAAARRERIDALEQEESTRSRRLAEAGGQVVRAEPWVELDAVRHSLRPHTVLIELAQFPIYDFAVRGRKGHWLPAHYAAWIIPPTGQGDVRIVDLGEADAIDQAVAAARRAFMKPRGTARRGLVAEANESEAEKALREAPANLAALVLQPILDAAADAERLIISPDAALWLVPWGALPLTDGRYAIQQYRIQYVISGRDLVAPHSTAAKTASSAVMADPDYDLTPAGALAATEAVFRKAMAAPIDQLALRATSVDRRTLGRAERLPGTAKEAKAIAPMLADYDDHREPTLYLARYALEGVFKALSRPKILVLSTHGFFLSDQQARLEERDAPAATESRAPALAVDGKPLENPLLRCGLLLAGCNQRSQPADDSGNAPEADDGILTGMEIVGTDLRGTELVVLSACETGLGEVHNGEGVAGLRQAFQLAGAEAVVASLWQVPDAQTAELMGLFFENLADKKLKPSKADALRNAQLKMIATHKDNVGSEPFYWAAFTLTGR